MGKYSGKPHISHLLEDVFSSDVRGKLSGKPHIIHVFEDIYCSDAWKNYLTRTLEKLKNAKKSNKFSENDALK